jgi:hypothetical protein
MAVPVLTADDVIRSNRLGDDYDKDDVSIDLPIAQNWVNAQLNDSYSIVTHGKEDEYRMAVAKRWRYLTISFDNLWTSQQVNTLGAQEAETTPLSISDVKRVKTELMTEISELLTTIKTAMAVAETDLSVIPGFVDMGGTIMMVGGNNESIDTDYGEEMENSDVKLKEELGNG